MRFFKGDCVEQEKGSNMAHEIKTQNVSVKLTEYSNFCHFLRRVITI